MQLSGWNHFTAAVATASIPFYIFLAASSNIATKSSIAVLCHTLQEMRSNHLHLIIIHRPLLHQLIESSPRNHDLEVKLHDEHCQIYVTRAKSCQVTL